MNSHGCLLLVLLCHQAYSSPKTLHGFEEYAPGKYNYATGEQERVIGGRDAADGQFPWTVALEFDGQFICTASLITPSVVLTAAHCVILNGNLQPASSFTGVMGAADRTSDSTTRVTFSEVIPHEEYDQQTLQNDIAIFKLTSPVTLSNTIQPVCLARPDTEQNEYRNATIMGWGRNRRNPFAPLPNVLQYKENAILPHATCQLRYLGAVTEDMICADGFGTGICSGDSGGPFTYVSPNMTVQIGVASFGRIGGCGSIILSPGVFTRVASYREWLTSVAPEAEPEICSV